MREGFLTQVIAVVLVILLLAISFLRMQKNGASKTESQTVAIVEPNDF